MPTYTFKNLETEEVFEKNCTISEMEEMQASGKYKQVIQSPKILGGATQMKDGKINCAK